MPRLPAYHPEVTRLLTDLADARKHVPYATGLGRALDGAEKWTKYDGKHRAPDSDRDRAWWAATLAYVAAVAALPAAQDDGRVKRLLAPWAARGGAAAVARPPPPDFQPFGRA